MLKHCLLNWTIRDSTNLNTVNLDSLASKGIQKSYFFFIRTTISLVES